MVLIRRVDYRRLKRDLLDEVGPSEIWPLIDSVENADEEELIEIARQLGYDVEDYEEDEEMEWEF
ncbi:hypothetical protein [Thermobrachium celere]|uniref:hypothetical protein n=1 Tax=Thermobrachium celere TaxID=53422 RepID=UPI001942CA1F|nr:hypothetical protein [Thermobrachium celere]GFR35451.1 hypothetical protein TCEA9_12630 [Thermobrachium celere]